MGPFEIVKKISRAAYELRLLDAWSMHPIFHVSLLEPRRASSWNSPVDLQPNDIEPAIEPVYEVEKLLRWRKVQVGRKTILKFLVTWTGYPLEKAMWIPEGNLTYPRLIKQMIKRDKSIEDKGSSGRM